MFFFFFKIIVNIDLYFRYNIDNHLYNNAD